MMAKFNVGLMDNCMPVLILRSRDMIGIDSCLTKSPNHQLSKIIIKTVVRAKFFKSNIDLVLHDFAYEWCNLTNFSNENTMPN